jgi:protein O-mannosyl-transferase
MKFHSLAQIKNISKDNSLEIVKHICIFTALMIILLIAYSNSFHGDWVFDDFPNIIQNPYIKIKAFSWEEVKYCFYGLDQEKLSRPLSYFSFAVNYYFDGTNVFGYHLVNFTIHYLSTVFVFLFIYNTLKLPLLKEKYAHISYPLALLSTLFWAVNPVFVSSVTYIVQRMASMAALFYIMSMYFYLKGRTAQNLTHSISFFILCFIAGFAAMLTKENAVMLPVSVLLFDLLLIQGVTKENVKKFSKILLLSLLLILVIGLIYTDGLSNVFGGYEIRDFSMTQRLLTEPRVILFYLSLLFYPIGSRLTFLYDIDISRSLFQPWTTIPSILLILFIIGFAFFIARKRPLISFCIIFYFLNHLIEGSVFPLELMYEHRNYLPSMLLFVPISELMISSIYYLSNKKFMQYACAFSVVLIIAVLCYTTYIRNAIVSHEANLWLDNIEKYPNLSRPHSNLGNIYSVNEKMTEALSEFKTSMSLNNFGSSNAYALQEFNLGVYYFKKGEYDLAFPFFKSSYKKIPFYHSNVIYIAKIHLIRGENDLAYRLIESELHKYPRNRELNEFFSKTFRVNYLHN